MVFFRTNYFDWRLKSSPWMVFTFGLVVAFIILAGPAYSQSQTPPEIVAARINANSEVTRFTADITYAVGYNAFVLPSPYRVIVDIPDAMFDLEPGAGAISAGLITGFRYGQIDRGKSRIVIDVDGPVLIKRSVAVRAFKDKPARLVIDLVKTDKETFDKIHRVDQVANLVARQQAKKTAGAIDELIPRDDPPISARTSDPIAQLLTNTHIPLPRSKPVRPSNGSKQAAISAPEKLNKRARTTIVLDPGHGGMDPGAISKKGTKEKIIALQFAKALKAQLMKSGRFRVILTRDNDSFISLRNRVKAARKHNASLFIAIHADMLKSRYARGATFYTLSDEASDQEAAELAVKENRVDIIHGVDLGTANKKVTNILIDLAQRETKNHSIYFARKGVNSLKKVTRMHKRPLRAAGFVVLKAPDVPSVLLELGFLSNRQDEKNLTSKAWQKRTAKALASAISNYFEAKLAYNN